MRRTRKLTLFGALTLLMSVGFAGQASAHGYVQDPPSRAYLCSIGAVQNCGAIQWEPQSVEGPGNFPQAGPADGNLCAGGNERFSELDDPRNGNWPATDVRSGERVTFEWHNTARHATANWRYYITKPSWSPTEPLTRADLVLDPFLVVDGHGEQPGSIVQHTATLPDRSGRQMVYAVWEIADTANAFYQCIDLDFGGSNDGGNGDTGNGDGNGDNNGGENNPGTCDAPAWQPGNVYTEGDVVTYQGHEWRAKWWTESRPSGAQWGPWTQLATC